MHIILIICYLLGYYLFTGCLFVIVQLAQVGLDDYDQLDIRIVLMLCFMWIVFFAIMIIAKIFRIFGFELIPD